MTLADQFFTIHFYKRKTHFQKFHEKIHLKNLVYVKVVMVSHTEKINYM